MSKITIEKALIAKEALQELSGRQLPSKLDYWLGRLEDKLTPIEKSFNKIKDDLIKKLGQKELKDNIETGLIRIMPDKMEEYAEQINAVLQEECEEVSIKLKLEMFEGVEVNRGFFFKMGDFITE